MQEKAITFFNWQIYFQCHEKMVLVNLDVALIFYDCFCLLSLVQGVATSQKKICLPFLTEFHGLKFFCGKCFTVQ